MSNNMNKREGPVVIELPVDKIRRPLMRTRTNDPIKVQELMDSIKVIGLQVPAVHPISNLIDLKRRLGVGRRCFGYLHPAIPGSVYTGVDICKKLCGVSIVRMFDKNGLSIEAAKQSPAIFCYSKHEENVPFKKFTDEEVDEAVVKHERKRATKETIVGPAIDKEVAHEAVGLKPASLLPKEPMIKKKNSVLQIKVVQKPSLNELKDDSRASEVEGHEKEGSDHKPYATPEELENIVPREEILSLLMFKGEEKMVFGLSFQVVG